MNKDLREALSQNLTRQPWQLAVDAALNWGMDKDSEDLEEAYTVGRIWMMLRSWRDEMKQFDRTTYRYAVEDQMKFLGWPTFTTYAENAAFILVAVYGDDE